ncbi:hypothetical protein V5O48_016848 [Marasmius crinis-equi]|uniref:CCHC-type domain-containing protein n=1 Tax=Marasmius crinis-equi TaxID=585013 RepID=A0ABR3EQJ9_9AGAR
MSSQDQNDQNKGGKRSSDSNPSAGGNGEGSGLKKKQKGENEEGTAPNNTTETSGPIFPDPTAGHSRLSDARNVQSAWIHIFPLRQSGRLLTSDYAGVSIVFLRFIATKPQALKIVTKSESLDMNTNAGVVGLIKQEFGLDAINLVRVSGNQSTGYQYVVYHRARGIVAGELPKKRTALKKGLHLEFMSLENTGKWEHQSLEEEEQTTWVPFVVSVEGVYPHSLEEDVSKAVDALGDKTARGGKVNLVRISAHKMESAGVSMGEYRFQVVIRQGSKTEAALNAPGATISIEITRGASSYSARLGLAEACKYCGCWTHYHKDCPETRPSVLSSVVGWTWSSANRVVEPTEAGPSSNKKKAPPAKVAPAKGAKKAATKKAEKPAQASGSKSGKKGKGKAREEEEENEEEGSDDESEED